MGAATLVAALTGVALTMALALVAPAPSRAVGAGRAQTVVIAEGDTIWDLARMHAPAGRDAVAYMAEVVAMNEVDATALQPGMVLRLPIP